MNNAFEEKLNQGTDKNTKKIFGLISITVVAVMLLSFVLSSCSPSNGISLDRNSNTESSSNSGSKEKDVTKASTPEEYFDAAWTNTAIKLGSEITSIGDNKIFQQMNKIMSGDFNIDISVNSNSFASEDDYNYGSMPVIAANLSNSSKDKILTASVSIENMLDASAYLTNDKFILSLLEESIFISSKKPLDDILAFSDANELGLDYQYDIEAYKDIDISYSKLFETVSKYSSANTSLSKDTMSKLSQYYKELSDSFSYSRDDKEIEFNGVTENRKVTTIVVPCDSFSKFLRDSAEAIMSDKTIVDLLSTYGTYSYDIEYALSEISDSVTEDVTLNFIESDNRYTGVIVSTESEGTLIEIGAIGEKNMLDNVYMIVADGYGDTTKISIVGNNVNTDHYVSEVTVETYYETVKFTLDWDTTKQSDNFVLNLYSAGNIRGTFAVSGGDVVISLSSVRIGNDSYTFANNDALITISAAKGKIDVPSNPKALKSMTMEEIQTILLPLMNSMY